VKDRGSFAELAARHENFRVLTAVLAENNIGTV
jgi:hypothetical protein